MYAHALTYPSLRRPRVRRIRPARRAPFLRRNTQHMRTFTRRRATTRVSWVREVARVTVALANAAALILLLAWFA